MHLNRKTEIRRQVPAHLVPQIPRVVRPHHVPMLLHKQRIGPRRMHRDPVHTMPHLGRRVRNILRSQSLVDRLPTHPTIITPKRPRRRNRHINPLPIRRVQHDRMQAHSPRLRLPVRPRPMLPQPRKLRPRLAPVPRPKKRRIFHPRINHIRIKSRRFQMPNPLELPRMRRPVVPLVRPRHPVVLKLIPHRLPTLPAVVRSLHHLPKPAARLRSINPVRVRRRTVHVINLPTPKVRTVNAPLLPLPV